MEYETVTAELRARVDRGETITAIDPGSSFVECVEVDGERQQWVRAFNVAEGWAEILLIDKEPVGDELPTEKHYGRITFAFAPNAPRESALNEGATNGT